MTGYNGMLGQDLVPALEDAGHSVGWFPYKDIPFYGERVEEYDLVIHAAAMTDVDKCEQDPDEAIKWNAEYTGILAKFCKAYKTPLIYISTDMVFSGESNYPESETDKTGPINVYGMTKLLGEKIVQQYCKKYYILRTSWLYGKGKRNYVDYYRTEPSPSVPFFTWGRPTSTVALSRMIVKLIEVMPEFGIYHASCRGTVSKHSLAEMLGAKNVKGLNPCAPRPAAIELDSSKLEKVIGPIPTWQEAMEEYLGYSIK